MLKIFFFLFNRLNVINLLLFFVTSCVKISQISNSEPMVVAGLSTKRDFDNLTVKELSKMQDYDYGFRMRHSKGGIVDPFSSKELVIVSGSKAGLPIYITWQKKYEIDQGKNILKATNHFKTIISEDKSKNLIKETQFWKIQEEFHEFNGATGSYKWQVDLLMNGKWKTLSYSCQDGKAEEIIRFLTELKKVIKILNLNDTDWM